MPRTTETPTVYGSEARITDLTGSALEVMRDEHLEAFADTVYAICQNPGGIRREPVVAGSIKDGELHWRVSTDLLRDAASEAVCEALIRHGYAEGPHQDPSTVERMVANVAEMIEATHDPAHAAGTEVRYQAQSGRLIR